MSNTKLSLAAEAYLYGYPLVEGVGTKIQNTSGPATVFSGPVNMFAHATKLAGVEFDGVLPFETDLVFVIGRTQLLGADDVPALDKLMESYNIQPLSAYRGPSGPVAHPVQWPVWNDEASREDASGEPLDGGHRYHLTLTTPPPAKAFWSVTMYDTSYDGTAGYLIENPINRYLINSTTEGLVYGDDGALTIIIQYEQPQDATEKANWLPASEGPFYLTMRIYWPKQDALDGTWILPPVRKM